MHGFRSRQPVALVRAGRSRTGAQRLEVVRIIEEERRALEGMMGNLPFFARAKPYLPFLHANQFPQVVDIGLHLLNDIQQSDPATYATHKGSPFYFMGIAAFASHVYQTATFFFDAAVAEDVRNNPKADAPARLFMLLDEQKQQQAARPIVSLVVRKLHLGTILLGQRSRLTEGATICWPAISWLPASPQLRACMCHKNRELGACTHKSLSRVRFRGCC